MIVDNAEFRTTTDTEAGRYSANSWAMEDKLCCVDSFAGCVIRIGDDASVRDKRPVRGGVG